MRERERLNLEWPSVKDIRSIIAIKSRLGATLIFFLLPLNLWFPVGSVSFFCIQVILGAKGTYH